MLLLLIASSTATAQMIIFWLIDAKTFAVLTLHNMFVRVAWKKSYFSTQMILVLKASSPDSNRDLVIKFRDGECWQGTMCSWWDYMWRSVYRSYLSICSKSNVLRLDKVSFGVWSDINASYWKVNVVYTTCCVDMPLGLTRGNPWLWKKRMIRSKLQIKWLLKVTCCSGLTSVSSVERCCSNGEIERDVSEEENIFARFCGQLWSSRHVVII